MSEDRINSLYWAYNLPLQVWPNHEDPDDEDSKIIGSRILNYMPRKERCCDLDLDEARGSESREEFLLNAAVHLENLAKQFRDAAVVEKETGNIPLIYYHDKGLED
jgi:hypothetical protein